MRTLLWLAAPLSVTLLAMLWAAWVGRPPRQRRQDEDQRRLAAALAKPLPDRAQPPARTGRERPSGIAVRRSAPPSTAPAAQRPRRLPSPDGVGRR